MDEIACARCASKEAVSICQPTVQIGAAWSLLYRWQGLELLLAWNAAEVGRRGATAYAHTQQEPWPGETADAGLKRSRRYCTGEGQARAGMELSLSASHLGATVCGLLRLGRRRTALTDSKSATFTSATKFLRSQTLSCSCSTDRIYTPSATPLSPGPFFHPPPPHLRTA